MDTLLGIIITIVLFSAIFGTIYYVVKGLSRALRLSNKSITGTLLIVIGIIALLSSLMMDTSVAVLDGRINNIGLMADKQNYIIISGLMLLIGVFITLFSKNGE